MTNPVVVGTSAINPQTTAISGFGAGSLIGLCGLGMMVAGKKVVNLGDGVWQKGGPFAVIGLISLCAGHALRLVGTAATLLGVGLNLLSLVVLAEASGGVILSLLVLAGVVYCVYAAAQNIQSAYA